MRLQIDIPTPFHRLTNYSKHRNDFVVFVVDEIETARSVVLSECIIYCNADDLPGAPVLLGSDSNPGDLPPVNPPIRRAVSDGDGSVQPNPVTDPIAEILFSDAIVVGGGGYIFRSNIPNEFFNGRYFLSGYVLFSDTNEKYPFDSPLPAGVRNVINHIAYGNFRNTTYKSVSLSSFRIFMSCLEKLLSRLEILHLPLREKAWICHSLLSHMRSHLCCNEENKHEMGEALLAELAAAIEDNRFKHHGMALVAIGQLRDIFSLRTGGGFPDSLILLPTSCSPSAPVQPPRTATARVLYSLPLALVRDGYADSMDDHKLSSAAATPLNVGTDSFATSLWLRRGLTFLLDKDVACPVATFRSCHGVIPLLRSLRSPAVSSPMLFAARTDWASVSQLDRFCSLQETLRRESDLFRRSSLNLPLENIRALFSNASREEEGRILAGLLSLTSDIEAYLRDVVRGWEAYRDTDALHIVRVKEMLDSSPEVHQQAVEAFDAWMASLENLQVVGGNYMSIRQRMLAEEEAVNPSYRRLWGLNDYIRCKNILHGQDSHDPINTESKSQTNAGPAEPSAAVFVEVFAGIGKRGSCKPLLPQRAAAQGITFNQPQDLAVNSDGFGNPCYMNGVVGKVFVADSLNHAVRVLIKPNEAYTLVGNGKPGYGLGLSSSAQFQCPRGLCTVTMQDAGGIVAILVVADTNNHCIKGLVLSRSDVSMPSGMYLRNPQRLKNGEVFLIAGSVKGSRDGPGNEALLDFPTGICLFDSALYVCCRGDHTLRRITTASSVRLCLYCYLMYFSLSFTCAGLVGGNDSWQGEGMWRQRRTRCSLEFPYPVCRWARRFIFCGPRADPVSTRHSQGVQRGADTAGRGVSEEHYGNLLRSAG